MQSFKRYCSFIILILLLTGCAGVEKEKTSSEEQITIEPYNMSEIEDQLIIKTGVGKIAFFKLNGTLAEDDDLQISVEVYENGKYKEELLKGWGVLEKNYKDTLLSFGISDFNEEVRPLKLLSGIPSGLVTTNYSNNMTSFSFSSLIGEKVALQKNKPIYLVAWVGTTKNELRTIGSQYGELPAGIEESELAFLYRVLLTEKEKN